MRQRGNDATSNGAQTSQPQPPALQWGPPHPRQRHRHKVQRSIDSLAAVVAAGVNTVQERTGAAKARRHARAAAQSNTPPSPAKRQKRHRAQFLRRPCPRAHCPYRHLQSLRAVPPETALRPQRRLRRRLWRPWRPRLERCASRAASTAARCVHCAPRRPRRCRRWAHCSRRGHSGMTAVAAVSVRKEHPGPRRGAGTAVTWLPRPQPAPPPHRQSAAR